MSAPEERAAGPEWCTPVDQGPAPRRGRHAVLAVARRKRRPEDAGTHGPVLEGSAGPDPSPDP